jgi:hypothetical protein
MDSHDVKVSAGITAALAVIGAGWFSYDVYLAAPGGGANIGLGVFFLFVITPAAVWSLVTAARAFGLREVGSGWRALSVFALMVLAFMTIFLICWACLIGPGEPLIDKVDGNG